MKKRKKYKGQNKVFILLLIYLLATLLTACGGSSSKSESAADVAAAETVAEYETAQGVNTYSLAEEGTESTNVGEAANTGRKLIRTVDMNVETDKYDQLMADLEVKIGELGGYVEFREAYHGNSNSREGRNVRLKARIPAKRLNEFTNQVKSAANVTRETESVEDVTLTYVDLESHKKMLLTQQQRLIELLEQAGSIEDVIALESRLSEVRYQIESMEAQLRTYDNLVDYSTLNLYIEEVERYTPQPEKGSLERIRAGFSENVYRVGDGIKNFAIEFVIALPILAVWAAVIGILYCLVVVSIKQRKRIREKRMQMRQEKEDDK